MSLIDVFISHFWPLISVRTFFLLVLFIGVVVAFSQQHRCPRPARLVRVACLLMLFGNIATITAHAAAAQYIPQWLISRYDEVLAVASWLNYMLIALGIGILILAVFTDRRPINATDDDDLPSSPESGSAVG